MSASPSPLKSGTVPHAAATAAERAPTKNSQVALVAEVAPTARSTRQNHTPGLRALVGEAESELDESTTQPIVSARLRQSRTVTGPGRSSIQRRTGRWLVAVEVEGGAISRGAVSTHAPPTRPKPSSQAIPQVTPSQLALPFSGGAGQGSQRVPQLSGAALEAHAAPHAWKPTSQAAPHRPLRQTARPFDTVGQGAQEVPQVRASSSGTQAPPQM